MSLIVAVLNPRGVALVADGRSISISESTKEKFISTETQPKIFAKGPYLFSVYGAGFLDKKDLGQLIKDLSPADDVGAPKEALKIIANGLPEKLLKADIGLVCASYHDHKPQIAHWRGGIQKLQLQYAEEGKWGVQFYGSTELAKGLFDLKNPYIPVFDLQKCVDYGVFIVQAVARLQQFGERKMPTVGLVSAVGLVDDRGSRLLQEDDPTIKTQFFV